MADVDATTKYRLPQNGFIASTSIFLTLIILSSGLSIFLRIRSSPRPTIPLILHAISAVLLITCASIALSSAPNLYLSLRVALAMQRPSVSYLPAMLSLSKRLQASSFLILPAIYLLKATLIISFRAHLRTTFHRVWFLIALCATVLAGLGSAPLGFMVCANFSDNFINVCQVQDMANNARIYLFVTTTLDVITSVLAASIPVATLAPSPLALTRKIGITATVLLAFGSVLSAIIRAALGGLDDNLLDLPWLVFGFGLEACLLSLLATLPAVRAFFPQQDELVVGDDARGRSTHTELKLRGPSAERSVSREGILKVDVEVRVETGDIEEGRRVPPTPNVVKCGSGEGRRVSAMSDGEWTRMVEEEEERERYRNMARRGDVIPEER